MLLTGITVGIMTFIALVILVEKLPRTLRYLVYGHYFLADVAGTLVVLVLLPVTGAVTLLSAVTCCLLFSIYLGYRRATFGWKRLVLTKKGFYLERK